MKTTEIKKSDKFDVIDLSNSPSVLTRVYKFTNPKKTFVFRDTLETFGRTKSGKIRYKITLGGVNGNDPTKQISYVSDKGVTNFTNFLSKANEFYYSWYPRPNSGRFFISK